MGVEDQQPVVLFDPVGDLAGEAAADLSLNRVGDPVRACRRRTGPRLKCCSLAFQPRSLADRIERLPGDPVLQTERRHRSARRIIRPLSDRETDTRINRFNRAHPSNNGKKCHHQDSRKCHRSIEPELSPMS